jgi:hypothetical protein
MTLIVVSNGAVAQIVNDNFMRGARPAIEKNANEGEQLREERRREIERRIAEERARRAEQMQNQNLHGNFVCRSPCSGQMLYSPGTARTYVNAFAQSRGRTRGSVQTNALARFWKRSRESYVECYFL